MSGEFRQILGIKFYVGGMPRLLDKTAEGGLIVVPSAPVLANMPLDAAHREALLGSDFAITDSSYMILLWLILRRENLPRISGVRYLRGLLDQPGFRKAGATFWIMPSADDRRANREWLDRQGTVVDAEACVVAPIYPAGRLEDPTLVAQIEARHPAYVIINVGGGVQERLGYFLRTHLSYRPAILCTGAAIAFLSGRQIAIPVWADRLRLGWLFRSLASPKTFPPRLWKSLRLAKLLWKYGENAPG